MADTVEGLVKRLTSLIVRNPDGSFVTETDAALSEAASALEALVVERDEAREHHHNYVDSVAEGIADLEARALAAEAQRDKLRATLFMIAHSFTEDSHGGTKTLPAHEYQDMARSALADMGKPE